MLPCLVAQNSYTRHWHLNPRPSRLGQNPPDVRRNELVNFSESVEKFFNEIKECALRSQRARTDLVPSGLDNVEALAH